MAYVQVPADGVGKRVDTVTLTDAGSEVHRQKLVVTGGSGTAEVVVVTNAAPGAADFGLVVRQAGTLTAVVSGTVNVNGGVAVSGTATVAGNVVISGTATVAGVVGLTAGTAVIGDINAISRTVQVAIGTPFTLQGISTTVTVAGVVGLTAGTANIGHLNHISRTVEVALAGKVTLSGTADIIGFVQLLPGFDDIGSVHITATATVQVNGYTPAIMSSSHGPRCVTASTSSSVILVSSPGAGVSVHITQLMVGNFSGTLTKARIGTSASASTVVQPLAASGGGFVLNFDPPWKLSASEACVCSIKPNAADAFFTVNFFVAA